MNVFFNIVATNNTDGTKTQKRINSLDISRKMAVEVGVLLLNTFEAMPPVHSQLDLDPKQEYSLQLIAYAYTYTGKETRCYTSGTWQLKAADQPDQDFTATVGVDEIQAIADEEISRDLTAAEIELVYADVRRNYNWDDGLSFENFRIAIAQLDEE